MRTFRKYGMIALIFIIVVILTLLNIKSRNKVIKTHRHLTNTRRKIWKNSFDPEKDVIRNDKLENNSTYARRKTILLYNSFFEMKGWGFGVGSEPFKTKKCSYNQCSVTHDRNLLESSDAVLFHTTALGRDKPKIRLPHQRWVFFQMESPNNLHNLEYKNWNGLFNWTMTYRRDSDIHIRYGAVLPTSDTEDMYYHHGSNAMSLNVTKKTKLLAWMVSNCYTQAKRETLVKQLEKFISVDKYGKCSHKKLTCEINSTAHDPQYDCFTMLGNKYKFHLAVENSLCKDYVTEKLFNTMAYGMVPIVYGDIDYSELLPPHSYIDVTKFNSAKELAKFLTDLDKDDARYEEYFAWKKNYTAFGNRDSDHLSWCDLCEKLHTDTTPKVYEHIDQWWNRNNDCVDPRHIMKSWNI
ncbi:unnamed protein product [Owenia fusiformis]|uniref:Fucosyltransferase n=1 Tax=Owenia fusiformis TaxID=6347 RepID=A0A8S4PE83_OWEFU|nr:unnamed protein product [Owenia fusiformis]